MSLILRVDDLEVGMYITVLNGEKKKINMEVPYTDTVMAQISECELEREYGKGECLKIEAMDLPYIITSNTGISFLNNDTWDTRLTEFKKLSKSYIKARMKL